MAANKHVVPVLLASGLSPSDFSTLASYTGPLPLLGSEFRAWATVMSLQRFLPHPHPLFTPRTSPVCRCWRSCATPEGWAFVLGIPCLRRTRQLWCMQLRHPPHTCLFLFPISAYCSLMAACRTAIRRDAFAEKKTISSFIDLSVPEACAAFLVYNVSRGSLRPKNRGRFFFCCQLLSLFGVASLPRTTLPFP